MGVYIRDRSAYMRSSILRLPKLQYSGNKHTQKLTQTHTHTQTQTTEERKLNFVNPNNKYQYESLYCFSYRVNVVQSSLFASQELFVLLQSDRAIYSTRSAHKQSLIFSCQRRILITAARAHERREFLRRRA